MGRDQASRRDAGPSRRDPGAPRRDTGAGRRDASVPGRRGRQGAQSTVRRPLPASLEVRIQNDPVFQVTTLDGGLWIDPFSGREVPCDQGYFRAALGFYRRNPTYRNGSPLPLVELTAIRWRHDLIRLLPHEPRLRIFGRDGQGWLNPYSGAMHQDVARDEGKITMRTIAAMAKALSTSDAARSGVMLDNASLQQKVRMIGSEAERPRSGDESIFGLSDMEADLNRAKDVQAHMLSDLPELDGYDLAVQFLPHGAVSGDFYEVMPIGDGRLLLFLGDVSGHGVQAALVVATALKTLRILARRSTELVELLSQLNDELRGDLLPGQFCTMFAALFDPAAATLQVVLAGHHPMLLVNLGADEVLRKVGRKGMAIGLISGDIFRRSLQPVETTLHPGDICIQCTDGIFEAANPDNEEYGEHRFYGQLLSSCLLETDELVEAITADVIEYAGGQPDDDLTVFVLAKDAPDDGLGSGAYPVPD